MQSSPSHYNFQQPSLAEILCKKTFDTRFDAGIESSQLSRELDGGQVLVAKKTALRFIAMYRSWGIEYRPT